MCPKNQNGICQIGGLSCPKPNLRCPINPMYGKEDCTPSGVQMITREDRGYLRGWGPILRPLRDEGEAP
jgi:hypothetical protein